MSSTLLPSSPALNVMIRTARGKVFRAFTWTRDAASGIERARTEAKEFGFEVESIWAEEVA